MPDVPVDRVADARHGPEGICLAVGQGDVTWRVVNYEQPAAKSLATKFEIQMPVVVLAKMKEGEIKDWKRLDEVWGLVGDKPAFAKHVRTEIEADAFARQEAGGRDNASVGGRRFRFLKNRPLH